VINVGGQEAVQVSPSEENGLDNNFRLSYIYGSMLIKESDLRPRLKITSPYRVEPIPPVC
jgi:hypothetical protein